MVGRPRATVWTLLALLAAPPLVAQDEAASLLSDAEAALAAGRAAEAETLFRQVVARMPGEPAGYRGLARAFDAEGKGQEGVDALVELAVRAARAGYEACGREVLLDAARRAPTDAAVQRAVGRALLEVKQYQDAAARLRRAVELRDGEVETAVLLGSALWEGGEVEAAEEVLRRAASAHPASYLPRQYLGSLLLWQGRGPEAAKVLEAAVAANPASPRLRLELARAREAAGETEAAIAEYRRVVAAAPELPEAHYGLGMLLARAGDREAAAAALARSRELRQAAEASRRAAAVAQARLDAGWALYRGGRFAAAVEHFRSLEPTPDTLYGLAAALGAVGDLAAAAEALERAVAMAPERDDLAAHLEELRAAMGSGGR